MILIRSIFLYLDRTYVLQNASVMSLWDMGLDTFKTHIVDNKDVNKKIGEGLLQLIEKERQGDTVDRSLLKSLLRMLSDLGMYGDTFESKYDIIDYFSFHSVANGSLLGSCHQRNGFIVPKVSG